MFAIDAHGSAGAFDSPFWMSSIEMLSGVRMKAMWPSRGGRLIVTPAALSLAQSRIDVVDGIGEMAEIAPAFVVLGVPVVGELDGRLPARLRLLGVVGGGEKHQRVAALLVFDAPRLDKAHELEKRDRRLEVGHADHRMQIFHGLLVGVCFVNGFGA